MPEHGVDERASGLGRDVRLVDRFARRFPVRRSHLWIMASDASTGLCGGEDALAAAVARLGSGQKLPILPPSRHRVDDHLLAALEDQHNGLQQPRLRVEPEPQLATWPLLFLEGLDPQRQVGSLDRVLRQDPVLERTAVDLHAA